MIAKFTLNIEEKYPVDLAKLTVKNESEVTSGLVSKLQNVCFLDYKK